jgi:hypothetical protein
VTKLSGTEQSQVRRGFTHAKIYQSGPVDAMIELDGQNVADSIRGLTVTLKAGDLPTLVLDPVVEDISLELENPQVYVSAAARHLLIKIGWTPPEAERGPVRNEDHEWLEEDPARSDPGSSGGEA